MKFLKMIILLILCIFLLININYPNLIKVEAFTYKSETTEIKTEEIEKTNSSVEKEENKMAVENEILEEQKKSNTNKQIPQELRKENEIKQEKKTVKVQNTKKVETVKTSEKKQISSKNPDKLGTFGRIYIPSINLDVAVYYAHVWEGKDYNAQTIVDAKDSAAFYELGNQYIIADHNYQGFNKLSRVNKNTKAYIIRADGTRVNLKVKNIFLGKNIVYDLVNSEGISIQNLDSSLVLYTCYDNKETILITQWELA